jgi:hypothetical protein
MALASTGLTNVFNKLDQKMPDIENQLRNELGAINDGGDLTQLQLLRLQYLFARNSVTGTTFSNIIKESSDGLKSIASKIG